MTLYLVMIPLAGSGMVQVTLIESDERGSAETSCGADGAEERVLESRNKSWRNRAIPRMADHKLSLLLGGIKTSDLIFTERRVVHIYTDSGHDNQVYGQHVELC